MGNILNVVYEEGNTSYRASEKIWRYNYGQILRLQGFHLPKATEVQFSYTERGGESVTRIATSKDNVADVVIPDSMLENGDISQDYKLYAFVYIEDGNAGTTEYKITISVRSRPKPEQHESPETQEIFKETVKLVNQYADEAEASKQSAEQSANESAESAKSAKQSADSAKTTKEEVETLGKKLEDAKDAAIKEVNTLKQNSLDAIEAEKVKAVETVQEQETSSKSAVKAYTDEEIERANVNASEAKRQLDSSIASANSSKKALDTSTEYAVAAKAALDSSIASANSSKKALDTSTESANKTKTALDNSVTNANTSKSNLDKTNEIANNLDASLQKKIEEGNQLKEAIVAEGQKQLSIVEQASEEIVADKKQINANKTAIEKNAEQISKNKNDITMLHAEIKELKKKTSIDSYEELAEALASGSIEKYVALGDELMVNKITSLSVSSNNSNLTFSVTDEQKFIQKIGRIDDDVYVFEYRDGAWNYMEESVDLNDFGIVVNGTVTDADLIQVTMNYTQVSYTFVDFDPTGENATHPANDSVEHFAVLEQTYVPDAFNFDAPESAICITPGYTLVAGIYYIYNNANAGSDYWCNYKRLYYVFEITEDIVATEETGDIQLRYYARGNRETTGDARGIYELTCKPYCCATDALYNDSTVKFTGQVAKPTEDYVDLRTLEGFTVDQSLDSTGIIYNNLGHVCYGNNEWDVSNLRQRMQNTEKSMKPVRTYKNDIVTAMKNVRGYMWGLDPRFIDLVQPCVVTMQHAMNDEFTRYELYTCEDTATLLSMKEMSFNYQTNEGVACKLYSLYTDNQLVNTAVASRAKARQAGSNPQDYRWARSAIAHNSSSSRLVSPTGANDFSSAISGYRFAPAYVIGVAGTSKNLESAEA